MIQVHIYMLIYFCLAILYIYSSCSLARESNYMHVHVHLFYWMNCLLMLYVLYHIIKSLVPGCDCHVKDFTNWPYSLIKDTNNCNLQIIVNKYKMMENSPPQPRLSIETITSGYFIFLFFTLLRTSPICNL